MSFEKSTGSNSGAPWPETSEMKSQSMSDMAPFQHSYNTNEMPFESSTGSNSGAPWPETSEKKSQSMSGMALFEHSYTNDSDPSAPLGGFRSLEGYITIQNHSQVGTAREDHIVKQDQYDIRPLERSENSNSSERRRDPPSKKDVEPRERSKPSAESDSVPAESQQKTVDFTMSFNGKHFKKKVRPFLTGMQFRSDRSELPSNQPGGRLN